MFEMLFGEEDGAATASSSSGCTSAAGKRLVKVVPPRGLTRLCGLANLGSTCYLNSLLQVFMGYYL